MTIVNPFAPLTERRVFDRKKMAFLLQELIVGAGARCSQEYGYLGNNKRIDLRVEAARGLQVTVTLNGNSVQPDTYVLSWHMAADSDAKLNEAFFGGNVNPHHKRKATYIASGFDDLKAKLQRGLTLAANGNAFLQDIPA
jgi:hypothetical protein